MKRINIFYIGSLLFLLTACSKNFLNKTPINELSDEQEWGDIGLAETFLNGLYAEIPWGVANTSALVDESRSRPDADNPNMSMMRITPDDPQAGDWNGDYSRIKHTNTFISHMKVADFGEENDDLGKRLLGEGYFIRAYHFFDLLRYYGGFAIIRKVFELDDDFFVTRDSFEDCVEAIVSDLDSATSLLPPVQTGDDMGRVGAGTAMALKSRVLLYAASDLYNPDKNSLVTADYTNPELLGYTMSDFEKRWERARDAAKAVMDLGVYELYMPEPTSAEEASENIYQLSISKSSVEDIFVRYMSNLLNQGYDGWGIAPNGWNGNGGRGVTAELQAAYEFADGSPFDYNSDWDNNPYENRDPRFYGTVLFEGAPYRPRPSQYQNTDPVGVGQFGKWEVWKNGKKETQWGLDTRNSVANPWNGNYCGATIIKYLDRNVDIEANNQDLTWRWMRYAEVLLNFAEASIELGEDAPAREAINQIRKRAFMPDVTASGEDLMRICRNERRVELAFEDHRFFDVRRWMVGEEAYHPIHGVDITYELLPDNSTSAIPEIKPVEITDGIWDKKAYFFPINRTEMQRNPELIQNPGYN